TLQIHHKRAYGQYARFSAGYRMTSSSLALLFRGNQPVQGLMNFRHSLSTLRFESEDERGAS
ncbi:MAG: hypothetical protein ACK2UO_02950, partial [Caldilineaceae bacterium]